MTRRHREHSSRLNAGSFVGGYSIVRVLKKGSGSVVYEAEDIQASTGRHRRKHVALKVLQQQPGGKCLSSKNVRREIEAAKRLRHSSFAELLDIIGEGDQLVLVLELIQGPDLLELLDQCGGRIPESLASYYFAQLVTAVGRMHAINYCHRDLKLENVMIDASTKTLKVIDLGLASPCELAVTLGIGTLDYMSPEMILGNARLDPKAVDIWSLGVVLYAMVAGQMPFQRSERSKTNISVLCRNILSGNMRIMPQEVSPQCQDLILSLLQQQPSARPSIAQISQHAWLNPASVMHPPRNTSHWVDQPGNDPDLTAAKPLDKEQAWVDESAADVICPDDSAYSLSDANQLETAPCRQGYLQRKYSPDKRDRDRGKRRHCRCSRHRHGHSRRASHAANDRQHCHALSEGLDNESDMPWMRPLCKTAVSFTGNIPVTDSLSSMEALRASLPDSGHHMHMPIYPAQPQIQNNPAEQRHGRHRHGSKMQRLLQRLTKAVRPSAAMTNRDPYHDSGQSGENAGGRLHATRSAGW